ncbi:MAG: hypothetical protein GX574_11365 [Lentisphaerae bacterium]|nr:hypothetical protein [Lentisphaerota bacterium]
MTIDKDVNSQVTVAVAVGSAGRGLLAVTNIDSARAAAICVTDPKKSIQAGAASSLFEERWH